MRVLVVAEVDRQTVRNSSRSAITFARKLATQTGGSVQCLLCGSALDAAAKDAAKYCDVVVADHKALEKPVADRLAQVIAEVVKSKSIDLLVAASTSTAKDVIARAAGLLGGAMAGDVIGHEFSGGELLLKRPMYAGQVIATVTLQGPVRIVTVRSSAYEPALADGSEYETVEYQVEEETLPKQIHYESLQSKSTGRPDVTEAQVIVSGGRAIKNSEDFERLVGGLADILQGATGSSRALVDAGITPNEFQIGQTGKVVAPKLYIALGISGAVQHLAGMKNSKVIVAINSDTDAPIFEVADYGLVGDVYELVPQMIEKLHAG